MKRTLLAAMLLLGLAGAAISGGLTKADWDYLVQMGYDHSSYAIVKINARPDAAKIWNVVHQKINASYPSGDAKATAVNDYIFSVALDSALQSRSRP